MILKKLQYVFLCIMITAVGYAHSGNDAAYLNAKNLLASCEDLNSHQDRGEAKICYSNVLKMSGDICPTDDCPLKYTNLFANAQDAIDEINISIGPPPGAEICSCEIEERYRSIAAKYNYSITNNISDANAWNDRGAFFAERCCLDEAHRSFEEAIRINSQLAESWYNMGVLIYEDDPMEALECFNQTIEIDPELAEAWFNRCSLLLSFGVDLESQAGMEAQRSYDKALELKPELGEYFPPYLVFLNIG